MSQNIKELYGNKLAARDGDIGKVKDFYFDDKTWVIRYMVADTGSWLPGRLVLLSPYAFGKSDLPEKTVHVRLSKKQIEDSPSLEAHMPVSRQFEKKYHSYYLESAEFLRVRHELSAWVVQCVHSWSLRLRGSERAS